MAMELVTDHDTKTSYPASFPSTEDIHIFGLQHGFIIYSRRTVNGRFGDQFMVPPPLTIAEKECDDLVTRLEATLRYFAESATAHMTTED
jgi:adenosylmethionine-8-amino-7-oxononanoate aminotransferase